jgi:putative NIF3 family GTP cyclohydrolase 1 type 2
MTATIHEIIDQITQAAAAMTPDSALPGPKSVDTHIFGNPSQPITGIIVTFLATDEVLDTAVAHGANLIISHETIFYNHQDEIGWLQKNSVYEAKRSKIDDNGLVVWRFHDYPHRTHPDMIVSGLVKALAWEAYTDVKVPLVCCVPQMTLRDIAAHVKNCLNIDHLRVIGDLDQPCQGIGLSPGFMGKEGHIQLLSQPDIDVIICGEVHEWETSEYVRDALHMGHGKGLIITGHAESEAPGMHWIAAWIQQQLPELPIEYLPTGKLFHWL